MLKGMKYNGRIISSERDLLKFFYKTCRIRFLIGQSICWPNSDEMIGRVTFAISDEELINAFYNMERALEKLEDKEDYIIRFNKIEDQSQMARIKIDGWRNAYDKIIASKYLKALDYEEQTQRYYRSFDEYKDLVLVAVKGKEVLGYSCFDLKEKSFKYDSELVSLYVKKDILNNGIGTNLLNETIKELRSKNKKSMIVWCLSDNQPALKFYEKNGGIRSEEKMVKIGNEIYKEYGYYFDLEKLDNENSF